MAGARGAVVGPSGITPAWLLVGASLTVGSGFVAGLPQGRFFLIVVLGLATLALATWCFVEVPHLAFAVAIPLFVVLPTVKILAGEQFGPVKDGVIAAAGLALLLCLLRGHLASPALRADRLLILALAVFALLYVSSPVSPHGSPWFHSTRLALEPVILLLASLFIPGDRKRIWLWAQWSMIVTCVPLALYGLVQQAIGTDGLLALGYDYGAQVRQIDGNLRSFGTLDEPFSYSAVLTLGLALVVMSRTSVGLKLGLGVPIALGLAAALVRTSLLTCLLLLAVWLLSRRNPRAAVLLFCVAIAAAGLLLARAEGTQQTTVTTNSGSFTLNGRVDAWEAAVGGPENWLLGRGPGSVGTGAQRAATQEGAAPPTEPISESLPSARAVDSGYLAVVADVGFAGLLLLTVVFARLAWHAWIGGNRGSPAGWAALALIAVVAGDAVTRSSFAAFPTAPLAFLLIGAAVSAAASGADRTPTLSPDGSVITPNLRLRGAG